MDNDMNNAPMDGDEEGLDLIVLTDEEGAEHSFELVDTLEHDGKSYVALLAAADEPELLEGDGNLVIMKIVTEEDGEEILELIEDDNEFEAVSEIFMERLSDLYDFEEIDGE